MIHPKRKKWPSSGKKKLNSRIESQDPEVSSSSQYSKSKIRFQTKRKKKHKSIREKLEQQTIEGVIYILQLTSSKKSPIEPTEKITSDSQKGKTKLEDSCCVQQNNACRECFV